MDNTGTQVSWSSKTELQAWRNGDWETLYVTYAKPNVIDADASFVDRKDAETVEVDDIAFVASGYQIVRIPMGLAAGEYRIAKPFTKRTSPDAATVWEFAAFVVRPNG